MSAASRRCSKLSVMSYARSATASLNCTTTHIYHQPPRRARACFISSRRSGDPADHDCGAQEKLKNGSGWTAGPHPARLLVHRIKVLSATRRVRMGELQVT